ncbi:gamma carbonic anhydrase family protein [Gammaproteobacteria bacterium 53_120_T64]|nr:gamma carbonic anhydrase family protein [Gammaproteobacteria bacterium 53_120_T64]
MIYQYADRVPTLGKDVFVAPSADVIGSVNLGDQVSVWFGAVIRGDTDIINIGAGTNVQDTAVIHTDPGIQANIGCNITIGHCAMIHGCTIGDNSLIGINAVILNGAVIGKNCLIGANALVPEGMVIPDNSMVLGTPAKIVRELDEKTIAVLQNSAAVYIEKAASFRSSLTPLDLPS